MVVEAEVRPAARSNVLGSQLLIHRRCIGISPLKLAAMLQLLAALCLWDIILRMGKYCLNDALALAGLLEQVGPLKLTWIIGLPVHGNAVQGILEGFARAGVHHAGLWYQ